MEKAQSDKIKIGLIGVGMVGEPVKKWFLEEKKYQRGKDFFCCDTDPQKGYFDNISQATIIFICVPTPSNPDGSCNTSIVESVVSQLPDRKNRRNWCIVIKSTVSPETTAYLCRKYKKKGCFLFSPEFLTEKQAWTDFIRPDRQIVAAADEESRRWLNLVMDLLPTATYNSPGFFQTKDGGKKYHFHEATSTEAELVKYGGNFFGALKVIFSVIIAKFCELFGADDESVLPLISYDRRIRGAWMNPYHGGYYGFGGYCFIKDLDALIAAVEKKKEELNPEIPKEKELKDYVEVCLKLAKAFRECNVEILRLQALTLNDVCSHDIEVEKHLKEKGE